MHRVNGVDAIEPEKGRMAVFQADLLAAGDLSAASRAFCFDDAQVSHERNQTIDADASTAGESPDCIRGIEASHH
jgi:hypothetical protein